MPMYMVSGTTWKTQSWRVSAKDAEEAGRRVENADADLISEEVYDFQVTDVRVDDLYAHEVLPKEFLKELESLLHQAKEFRLPKGCTDPGMFLSQLAGQVKWLKVTGRCNCGDEFCATFFTKRGPQDQPSVYAVDIKPIQQIVLDPEHGTIVVDVYQTMIVQVEVLNRPEVKECLDRHIPTTEPCRGV